MEAILMKAASFIASYYFRIWIAESWYFFKEVSILYKQEMAPGTIAKIYRYFDDKYVKVVFKSIDDSVIYLKWVAIR